MLFLASCSQLPVYKSKNYEQNGINKSPNSIADMYDKKANVYYGFANDKSHFYIQAVFSDRESLMKIMRGGLIIYFDPNGKKKKDYQLKIEKTDQLQNDYTMLSTQRPNPVKGERQSMPSTIAMVLNKVTWNKSGKEFVFYRNMQKEPVLVELLPAEQEQLILAIKMPLSEIPLSAGNSMFSVGIATGKDDLKGLNGNRPDGIGEGMRPEGGMGGGIRPGGGMGGSGGRPAGAPSSSSSGMSSIEIWCKIQL